MSRFWPQAAYAEDQPYYKAILQTHVMYRGFQVGAITGTAAGLAHSAILWRNSATPVVMRATMLSYIGIGAILSTVLCAVATPVLMRSREEIEWRDRSWRLLQNKGQVAVDDWSLAGSIVGAAAVAARKEAGKQLGWKRFMGGVGLGNMAGIVGYMAWRGLSKGEEVPEIKKALGPLEDKV